MKLRKEKGSWINTFYIRYTYDDIDLKWIKNGVYVTIKYRS